MWMEIIDKNDTTFINVNFIKSVILNSEGIRILLTTGNENDAGMLDFYFKDRKTTKDEYRSICDYLTSGGG